MGRICGDVLREIFYSTGSCPTTIKILYLYEGFLTFNHDLRRSKIHIFEPSFIKIEGENFFAIFWLVGRGCTFHARTCFTIEYPPSPPKQALTPFRARNVFRLLNIIPTLSGRNRYILYIFYYVTILILERALRGLLKRSYWVSCRVFGIYEKLKIEIRSDTKINVSESGKLWARKIFNNDRWRISMKQI